LEGVLGGIAGAVLIGFAFGYFIETADIILSTAVCFVGAFFSVMGDMSASAIKRYTDIKDFGNVFPGHGGVLDRFDSVLFTAPVVYFAVRLWT
jgi:phosphatidate cytidylyltransferase